MANLTVNQLPVAPVPVLVTDKILITRDGIIVNQATTGTLPISTATQTALDLKISNGIVFLPIKATTLLAPTYVLGGVYFDTTLNKLRVGGATTWETLTSV